MRFDVPYSRINEGCEAGQLSLRALLQNTATSSRLKPLTSEYEADSITVHGNRVVCAANLCSDVSSSSLLTAVALRLGS